jgi:hypothetical protein
VIGGVGLTVWGAEVFAEHLAQAAATLVRPLAIGDAGRLHLPALVLGMPGRPGRIAETR